MKHIGNLKFSEGAKHKKKRIARGTGSGFGGTSTRGHKGQKSRKSYGHKRGFEGGQMPLVRRIPKFGFNNNNRVEYQIINVGQIQELVDKQKIKDTVDLFKLNILGVIRNDRLPLKILGNGNLSENLHFFAQSFSKTAKKKIEEAGGKVIIHG